MLSKGALQVKPPSVAMLTDDSRHLAKLPRQILEAATRHGADLIVLDSRGVVTASGSAQSPRMAAAPTLPASSVSAARPTNAGGTR